MKFTFKKHIAVGRYRSFELDQTDIKIKRKEVGLIAQERNNGYCIRFTIVDEASATGWKWITLKRRFSDEGEARAFLNEHINAILRKYDLFHHDP